MQWTASKPAKGEMPTWDKFGGYPRRVFLAGVRLARRLLPGHKLQGSPVVSQVMLA